MAFKLVALFRQPDGPNDGGADFDEAEAFLAALPDVQRVTIGRVTGTPKGESPFARIVELYFETEEACRAALASPELRAKGKSVLANQGKMKLMFVDETAR